jgi:hypothetical protein
VRQRGHGKSRGIYFFYEKGHENNRSETGFLEHHRTVSAAKRVEFISDRMSYIVLRGRRCKKFVLNKYQPSEEKSDNSKDTFVGN